jgi:hypothetical protein
VRLIRVEETLFQSYKKHRKLLKYQVLVLFWFI